jgi:hypothetical protein
MTEVAGQADRAFSAGREGNPNLLSALVHHILHLEASVGISSKARFLTNYEFIRPTPYAIIRNRPV